MTEHLNENVGERAIRGLPVEALPQIESTEPQVEGVREPASVDRPDEILERGKIEASSALKHATKRDIKETMRVVSQMESLGNKAEYSEEDIRYLADQLHAIIQKVPGIGIEINLSKISYPEKKDMYATEVPGKSGVYKLWEKGMESIGSIGITTNPNKFTDDVRTLN